MRSSFLATVSAVALAVLSATVASAQSTVQPAPTLSPPSDAPAGAPASPPRAVNPSAAPAQPSSAPVTPTAAPPASPPRAPGSAELPTCGSEANQQNLTGQARTAFVAECHRRRGDVPNGSGSGSILSTTRLPTDRARVGRSRQECREIARTRHLWGLARHKFLQRCRYGTTRRTPALNR